MVIRVAILSAVSLLLAIPAPSSAQETQQPSDPEADSPSGVVYELPFDRARDDAAPRRRERSDRRRAGSRQRDDRNGGRGEGGGDGDGGPGTEGGTGGGQSGDDSGGGGPAPGRDPTSIRSENNFGSSSQVPGVDDGAGSRDDRDGAAGDRASAEDGELGATSGGGGTDRGGAASPDPASASTAGSSDTIVISLLGLILIVGAGLGVMAGRARRRSA